MLNSERFETYPQAKAASRDHTEQMRHMSDPMELSDMAPPAEDDCEGDWEEEHTVRCAKGKGKAERRDKPKAPARGYDQATELQGSKGPQRGAWAHDDPDYFPYDCHDCGVVLEMGARPFDLQPHRWGRGLVLSCRS